MNLTEAMAESKRLDDAGIVPNFDDTLYFCPTCQNYVKVRIRAKGTVPPGLRVEYPCCNMANRLTGFLLRNAEHSPIMST